MQNCSIPRRPPAGKILVQRLAM